MPWLHLEYDSGTWWLYNCDYCQVEFLRLTYPPAHPPFFKALRSLSQRSSNQLFLQHWSSINSKPIDSFIFSFCLFHHSLLLFCHLLRSAFCFIFIYLLNNWSKAEEYITSPSASHHPFSSSILPLEIQFYRKHVNHTRQRSMICFIDYSYDNAYIGNSKWHWLTHRCP